MIKIIPKLVFILCALLLNCVNSSAPDWNEHDISTLKLLQIVHRHGERTALKANIAKTDPFKDISNWKEGYGQLTKDGKVRMYRMGEYLREWYSEYLNLSNPNNSPRLVYTRSSLEHRCLESVSALLSGMYPPKGMWQWQQSGLGQIWQPFPIETFMPKDDDTVLVPHKTCPKAQEEHDKVSASNTVKKIIRDFQNEPIYGFLKELFQDSIDSLYRGQMFWDTLKIEKEHGLIWPDLNSSARYSQEDVIKALEPLGVGSYVYDWNRDFIRTIRLGKLIEILISNMNSVIRGQTPEERKQLYLYSTHDSIVVPLMQALGPYNNQTPPYGAAILLELHEDLTTKMNYVKIYYYNETDSKPFPFLGIDNQLSLKEFESRNKRWFYSDFEKECGIAQPILVMSEMTFMVIGIAIGIGLLGLNIFAFKYIRSRKNSFQVMG